MTANPTADLDIRFDAATKPPFAPEACPPSLLLYAAALVAPASWMHESTSVWLDSVLQNLKQSCL